MYAKNNKGNIPKIPLVNGLLNSAKNNRRE